MEASAFRAFYSGSPLERVSGGRAGVGGSLAESVELGARLVPLWRDDALITAGEPPRAVVLSGAPARPLALAVEDADAVLLGMEGTTPWHAVDLSQLEDREALALTGGRGEFRSLRRVGLALPGPEAAILAHARGVLHWHRHNRYCSGCGGLTVSRDWGHVRVCLGETCGRHHFPRTDPAVIMLVTRGDRCLLGRQARWPEGFYSTLAGFVEPGETVEEAVIREVAEEAGVRVAAPVYRGSQPWPFPSSLMLGFRAPALDEVIVLRDGELADARWFHREEVRSLAGVGLTLPGRDSISRFLIEEWINESPGEACLPRTPLSIQPVG